MVFQPSYAAPGYRSARPDIRDRAMKKQWLFFTLACALFGNCFLLRAQTPRREVAFTIDDLPMAQDTHDLEQVRRVNKKLLDSLVANHIPATGFVNERNLYVRGETDARIDVLRAWLDAGMSLGNHSFSHADFNKVSLPEFEDEAVRGEVVTRGLMREKGLGKLYFRYPYNHTGLTREVRDSFQGFLKSRGYEVAPFTVEHEDYIFADAYRKAKQKKDDGLAQRIRGAYLDFLDTMFNYFERRSREVLGYEVKQIFLIHDNQLNADSISAMAERLKARGYSFITLDEALRDPAYQNKDGYVGGQGISWLHRWAIGLGKKLDHRDEPDAPRFVLDIYQAK
jgi:peptidoglycan/xylan/chitin deacetylase (PgdA/CDA1 family)